MLFKFFVVGCFLTKLCSSSEDKNAVACENQIFIAKCHSSFHYINVIRAIFGRFSLTPCRNDIEDANLSLERINLQCSASNSTNLVRKRCNNQSSCMLEASTEIFGDPCKGVPKYLEIHYYCEEKKTTYIDFQSYSFSTPTYKDSPSTTLVDLNKMTTRNTISPMIIVTTNDTLKAYKKCEAKGIRSIMWPPTNIGLTVQQKCPFGARGFASWYCNKDGIWYPPYPDLSDCGHQWVIDIESDFFAGQLSSVDSAKMLEQFTRKGETLLAGDLRRIINLISVLTIRKMDQTLTNATHAFDIHLFKYLLKSSDNVLSPNASTVWYDIPLQLRRLTLTQFLKNVENLQKIALNSMPELRGDLVATPNGQTLKNVTSDNIDLKFLFNARDDSSTKADDYDLLNTTFIHSHHSKQEKPHEFVSIKMPNLGLAPDDTIHSQSNKKVLVLSVALIKNVKLIYQDDVSDVANDVLASDIMSINKLSDSQDEDEITATVNTNAHLTQRPTQPFFNLKRNYQNRPEVYLTFPLPKSSKIGHAYKCVYLDYYNSSYSRWSTHGCEVHEIRLGSITCKCNHFTNFAILLDVVGVDIPVKHEIALLIITRVGCGISILCLALCILTFQYFRYHFNERINIHKHLCICLLMAELIFVFGIQASSNKYGCSAIAVFLHYFFLASFMWMLIEGIQLYTMLVEVFESVVAKIKYYTSCAYGIPIIIVMISFALYPKGYGNEKHCWLSVEKFFIFSFVGPVTIILAANVTFLVIALYILAKHFSRMPNHSEKSKFSKIKSWIKGAFILIFLMGLTWFFGLFFVSQETIFAAYLFTILNSLQGLFIFVFHCILNEKVVCEYKKLLAIKKSFVTFSKSTSIDSSNASSASYHHYKKEVQCNHHQPYHLQNGCTPKSSSHHLSSKGEWINVKRVLRLLKPDIKTTNLRDLSLTLPVVAEEDGHDSSNLVPISNSFLCLHTCSSSPSPFKKEAALLATPDELQDNYHPVIVKSSSRRNYQHHQIVIDHNNNVLLKTPHELTDDFYNSKESHLEKDHQGDNVGPKRDIYYFPRNNNFEEEEEEDEEDFPPNFDNNCRRTAGDLVTNLDDETTTTDNDDLNDERSGHLLVSKYNLHNCNSCDKFAQDRLYPISCSSNSCWCVNNNNNLKNNNNCSTNNNHRQISSSALRKSNTNNSILDNNVNKSPSNQSCDNDEFRYTLALQSPLHSQPISRQCVSDGNLSITSNITTHRKNSFTL